MADAGWYPDPSGASGQLRYFDGTTWTGEVLAQGRQPRSGSGGGSRGGLIALLAVVLVLGLLVWLVVRPRDGSATLPEDTNSSSPTISAWDETSTPTPTPTPSQTQPSAATQVACPRSDGSAANRMDGNRRVGGQLSFETRDWRQGGFHMPFAHDVSAEVRTIQPGWASNLAVGALLRADGFDDPARSARMMMDCLSTSSYYSTYSGRSVLTEGAVSVDGKSGYRISAEIHVSSPSNVKGDRVTIVIVDTGQPERLSFFVSAATIVDAGNIAEVEQTEKTLRVVP